MNNTKCPHCGLVNWSSLEVCERCGVPLGVDRLRDEARLKPSSGPETAT